MWPNQIQNQIADNAIKMPENILPNQTHLQSLKIYRKHELDIALKNFPATPETNLYQVLEVGAGTGQQAKYLREIGYSVSAIDLKNSSYKTVMLRQL